LLRASFGRPKQATGSSGQWQVEERGALFRPRPRDIARIEDGVALIRGYSATGQED